VEELAVSRAPKLEDFVSLSAQKLAYLNDCGSSKLYQIFSFRIKHTSNIESQQSHGNRTQRIHFQNLMFVWPCILNMKWFESNNSLYTVHTTCLPASQDSSQHIKCWKPYAVIYGLALLKMGMMVPETCWANGWLINHNCCIKLVSQNIPFSERSTVLGISDWGELNMYEDIFNDVLPSTSVT